jgi:hypothetical protein
MVVVCLYVFVNSDIEKREETVMKAEYVDGTVGIQVVLIFEPGKCAGILLGKLLADTFPMTFNGRVTCRFAPNEWSFDGVCMPSLISIREAYDHRLTYPE